MRLRLWARIHLEVKDLKVQLNDHQPHQQGDETDAPESTRKFLKERVSLRYRREEEELAVRKIFLPAGQLVFRPEAGLLALLGFVSMCSVKPAG